MQLLGNPKIPWLPGLDVGLSLEQQQCGWDGIPSEQRDAGLNPRGCHTDTATLWSQTFEP